MKLIDNLRTWWKKDDEAATLDLSLTPTVTDRTNEMIAVLTAATPPPPVVGVLVEELWLFRRGRRFTVLARVDGRWRTCVAVPKVNGHGVRISVDDVVFGESCRHPQDNG